MRENYQIIARRMVTTALGTIALPDSARLPTGNPNFMPANGTSTDDIRKRQEIAARAAIASVPFFIRADEPDHEVSTFGRPGATATTMKGTLRHVAARLTTRGMNNLSSGAVTLLFSGGHQEKKSKAKGGPNPSDIAHADRGIPLLGVFGSWTDGIGLKGGNFGNAYSKGHFTLQPSGIVRQPLGQQHRPDLELLSQEALGEIVGKLASDSESSAQMKQAKKVFKAASDAVKSAKKDGEKGAIEAANKDFEDARIEKDRIDKGREVSTGQLHGKWNIPVGVDFDFTVNHAMTDAELGLLIESFRVWMRRDRAVIGGDKGRGAGFMFDCEFSVLKYRDGVYEEIGTICTDPNDDKGSMVLDQFVAAFEETLPETRKLLAEL